MCESSIGVLIVASDPRTMRCWTHAVLADAGLRLIAAVGDRCGAMALIDAAAPDVLLVDFATAQGERIELIRHASGRRPRCDSLVVASSLGGDGDEHDAIAALAAGACGCLLEESASPGRIVAAIHELYADGAPLDPLIARHMLARFRVGRPAAAPAGAPSVLTRRETEILRLTAKGLVFETIGSLLDISPHTVIAHTRKIYQKLDVHSRGAAVHAASRNGWL